MVAEAAKRILSMSWVFNEGKEYSQIALMQEYLRRMALWKGFLKTPLEWPFFDVAVLINPLARAPEELVARVDEFLATKRRTLLERKTCSWYLHWMAVAEGLSLDAWNLPCPYDPLILFYDRGGILVREHDFIEVGRRKIRIDDWKKYLQDSAITELDEATLNKLDMCES